jgi:hypothetical protein
MHELGPLHEPARGGLGAGSDGPRETERDRDRGTDRDMQGGERLVERDLGVWGEGHEDIQP